MPELSSLRDSLARIDALVQELESSADPNFRDQASELVRLLLELHEAGLRQTNDIIRRHGATGEQIISELAADPVTAGLLLLHGLHPTPLPTRVEQALEKVRPLLASHGGNVTLLGVEEGRVRLQLEGSCHGCPSSTQTLKNSIEEAIIEAAPDLTDLHVAGVAEPAPQKLNGHGGFVPIETLVAR